MTLVMTGDILLLKRINMCQKGFQNSLVLHYLYDHGSCGSNALLVVMVYHGIRPVVLRIVKIRICWGVGMTWYNTVLHGR